MLVQPRAQERGDAVVGQLGRGAVFTPWRAAPCHERGEQVAGLAERRVRGADVEAAVVVRPRAGADAARGAARGGRQSKGRGFARQLFDELVLAAARQPVTHLPHVEQPEHRFELVVAQPARDERRGVRQGMGDALPLQVANELEDVEAQLLELGVGGLVDTPDQHVHVQGFRGKEGRQLFADDEVVVVRQAQRAFDGVTVCERHARHAAQLGEVVDDRRIEGRRLVAELAAQPVIRGRRVARMAVQIDALLGRSSAAVARVRSSCRSRVRDLVSSPHPYLVEYQPIRAPSLLVVFVPFTLDR